MRVKILCDFNCLAIFMFASYQLPPPQIRRESYLHKADQGTRLPCRDRGFQTAWSARARPQSACRQGAWPARQALFLRDAWIRKKLGFLRARQLRQKMFFSPFCAAEIREI